ncbi:MAG: uracil-DNA glycosylase [Spirochaetia bacterium]|nr:uracil-DNA glycosylase [Spirochaetia bacterium]
MSDGKRVRKMEKSELEKAYGACYGLLEEAERVVSGNLLADEIQVSPLPRFTLPEMPTEKVVETAEPSDATAHASLEQLRTMVEGCRDCRLCDIRNKVVFGEGPAPCRLMLIGEGPGMTENMTGRPFVGPSGDALTTWLAAIGLEIRRDVYISNVVKCFPGKRRPVPEEMDSCRKYLDRQIQLVQPQLILCLGRVAGTALAGTDLSLKAMRGHFHLYRKIPFLVTYHPAAVLRNPQWKLPVWHDMQRVARYLKLPIPSRR